MGALQRIAEQGRRLLGRSPRAPARAQYMRHDAAPFLSGWRPSLREAADDVRLAWPLATARAIDALQNSGWLAGAVDQAVASMVGAGLRLSARPDAEALGWTQDEASDWARRVERRFEAYASSPYECDARGRQSLGQITASATRTWFATGEILATLPFVRRPGSQTGTKVQLQPPQRLSQQSSYPDLLQGVRMDGNGMAVGYLMCNRTPEGMWTGQIEIAARDRAGRPQVVHVFDGMPGQVRGITPLAPALKVVRQYDNISDATLTAALIQTIFAATLESSAPSAEVLQGLQEAQEQAEASVEPGGPYDALMEARASWYEHTKIDLGLHGKIAHLFPNENLKFNRSEHPNTNYEPFVKVLLRELARCLGVTYEQMTGDYAGATFSSIRMSTADNWPLVLYRRSVVPSRLTQQVYEAWLEEDIEGGNTPFPGGLQGFVRNRAAASRSHWRGPAKPVPDDLKTARAQEILFRLGVATKEKLCAEYGDDWMDVDEQHAREIANRRRLGLPDPQADQAPKQQDADAAGTGDPPAGEGEDDDISGGGAT